MKIQDTILNSVIEKRKELTQKISKLETERNNIIEIENSLSLNKQLFLEYIPRLTEKLNKLGLTINSIKSHLVKSSNSINFTVHLRNNGNFKTIGSMKYRMDGKMTNDKEIENKLNSINQLLSNSNFKASFSKSSLSDNTISNKILTFKKT